MIYAIDFGTSNSLLAAADESGPIAPIDLAPGSKDPTILRSILFAEDRDTWYCGWDALEQYSEHFADGRLLRSIKKYLPDPSFVGTEIFGKRYKIEDLVAVFLKEMRQRGNIHFDQDVTSAILGRPAVFSLDPIKHKLAETRLLAAAKIAGFKDVEFCPEPLAASFEFRSQLKKPQLTLIADFGGGTSDFTVLNLSPTSFSEEDVLSIGGLSVAGDVFDGSIMENFVAAEFGTELTYRLPMGSVDLSLPKHIKKKLNSPADMSFLAKSDMIKFLKESQQWCDNAEDRKKVDRLFLLLEDRLGYRLFDQIEHSKIEFGSKSSSTITFDYPGINLEKEITTTDFNTAASPIVNKIVKVLDETIDAAGVSHSDIEVVCCTGGTAKINGLNLELAKRFGRQKLKEHQRFHSVINGLADWAHRKNYS